MRQLHIVGCPRSGTTLMAEMMFTCFESDGHCEHEESIFKTPADGYELYISKKPNDALWVAPLLDRDPNLYVIAMLRDPRAVITSIHSAYPDMYFCNYTVWKRAERAIHNLREHPRVVLIRYEDLVSDPDREQQRISERFAFLQQVHPFSEYHQRSASSQHSVAALGGIRAVDKNRIAGWMKHLPRLKQQLAKHPALLEDLKALGYETDDSWTEVLEPVAAVEGKCRYKEGRQPLKRIEQRLRIRSKVADYLKQRGLR